MLYFLDGKRTSTSKSAGMLQSRQIVYCPVQVGSEVLPQVKELNLGILFLSEGRMKNEMDRSVQLPHYW